MCPHFLSLALSVCFSHFSMCSSEPPAPNPASEAVPTSGGSPEPVKPPSESSLSPGPGTTDAETQGVGDAEVAPEEETEAEKAIRLLYCSLCKVVVNSASQLQAHNSGEKLIAVVRFPPRALCLILTMKRLGISRRHQAQDHARGSKWLRSHQVLSQDGGESQVGPAAGVDHRTPEQNFPL